MNRKLVAIAVLSLAMMAPAATQSSSSYSISAQYDSINFISNDEALLKDGNELFLYDVANDEMISSNKLTVSNMSDAELNGFAGDTQEISNPIDTGTYDGQEAIFISSQKTDGGGGGGADLTVVSRPDDGEQINLLLDKNFGSGFYIDGQTYIEEHNDVVYITDMVTQTVAYNYSSDQTYSYSNSYTSFQKWNQKVYGVTNVEYSIYEITPPNENQIQNIGSENNVKKSYKPTNLNYYLLTSLTDDAIFYENETFTFGGATGGRSLGILFNRLGSNEDAANNWIIGYGSGERLNSGNGFVRYTDYPDNSLSLNVGNTKVLSYSYGDNGVGYFVTDSDTIRQFSFPLDIPDRPTSGAISPNQSSIVATDQQQGTTEQLFKAYVDADDTDANGTVYFEFYDSVNDNWNEFDSQSLKTGNNTYTANRTVGGTGGDGQQKWRVRVETQYYSEQDSQLFTVYFPPEVFESNTGLDNLLQGESATVNAQINKGTAEASVELFVEYADNGTQVFQFNDSGITAVPKDYQLANAFTVGEVFTNYTLSVFASDTVGLSDSYNVTEQVENGPPEVRFENTSTQNADLDFYVEARDPEFDIDRVEYEIRDGFGNTYDSGQMNYITNQSGFRLYGFTGFQMDGDTVYFVDVTAYDTKGKSATASSSALSVNAPSITNFNVSPQIRGAEPGEQFSLSVEGDITDYAINEITYSLDVTDNSNPSSVTVSPDFQDQNSFSDTESNVFEMKDSWQGETLTFKVEVKDDNGLVETETISDLTTTPPDGFLLNQPSDGATFLIPEGETEIPVDIEYGVDTSVNNGTAKLFINGVQQDSFFVPASSSQTQTYTENFTEDEYSWSVKFTDGKTGETYQSGSQTFVVSEEPISLTLDEPDDGAQISILNGSTKSINHDFTIDARALSGDYYYRFQLNNTDDNDVVTTRTSSDFSSGERSHTEEVTGLSEGNYSWGIEAYRASDDTLVDQKSQTYTLVNNPKFEASILSPADGEEFALASNESNRNVNTTYDVRAYTSDVDVEFIADGNVLDTRTVSDGAYQSVDLTIQDLTEGQHTIKLNAVDGDGRTTNLTRTFDIVRNGEQDVTFDTLEARPSLDEARVGDEVDLYFEGQGNVSDVDFVQFEIKADGEVIKELTVPQEDLQDGSWFGTVDAAFVVTEELLNKEIAVVGEAQTAEGDTLSRAIVGVLGANRDITASLQRPSDGRLFNQTDGNVEPIRFDFRVSSTSDPVYWNFQLKQVGGSFQNVTSGWNNQSDSTQDYTTFVNHVDQFASQFGDFQYRVKASEDVGVPQTFVTPSRDYSIVQNRDVILNPTAPSDNEELYIGTAADAREVDFSYDIDTGESGTVNINLKDGASQDFTTIYSKDVNSGFTRDSITRELSTGTYTANYTFSGSSTSTFETRTFSVAQDEPDEQNAFVELREPSDGRTLYQGFGNRFSWRVFNPYSETADASGTSTLYIENEQGTIVEQFSRNYSTQSETNIYSELYDTSLNIGTYRFYANFTSPSVENGEIKSAEREFTVADFQPPQSTLDSPLNLTFTTNDSIEFEWTTETFDENADVQLRVREAGNYNAETIFEAPQDANLVEDYNTSDSFSAGKYEWFIRHKLDGGATFESRLGSFEVLPSEFKAPDITLVTPEQGDRFDVNQNNSSNVPFEYKVETFSQRSADVDLLIQNASVENAQFVRYYRDLQSKSDGLTNYNKTFELEKGGYRYKVEVEYPNGQVNESEVRTFAVGREAAIPQVDPTAGLLAQASSFLGDLNQEFKNAVGKTGQYFAATLVLILATIGIQVFARSELVSLMSAVLIALGFSFADGYYPIAVFYIVGAIAAGLVAWLSARTAGGGGN